MVPVGNDKSLNFRVVGFREDPLYPGILGVGTPSPTDTFGYYPLKLTRDLGRVPTVSVGIPTTQLGKVRLYARSVPKNCNL